MNCNDCECSECRWLSECGECGNCDYEHPHHNNCGDFEEAEG